jgi:hypothetical protein
MIAPAKITILLPKAEETFVKKPHFNQFRAINHIMRKAAIDLKLRGYFVSDCSRLAKNPAAGLDELG